MASTLCYAVSSADGHTRAPHPAARSLLGTGDSDLNLLVNKGRVCPVCDEYHGFKSAAWWYEEEQSTGVSAGSRSIQTPLRHTIEGWGAFVAHGGYPSHAVADEFVLSRT